MNNGRSNGRGRGRRGGSATAVANVVVQAQGLLKKLFALNSDAAAHTRVVFGEQLSTTLLFAVKTASSVEQQGLSALFYQFERDIDRILQDPRAPAPLKKAVALVVGAFGHLQMNTDHSYLRWLFDRLLAPSSPDMSKESRGEWKNWLLLALKEFLDPAPPYSYEAAHLRTEIPFLMGEMQNFLDAMEASDHLPKALDILHVIERRYPREFSVSFRDLVDLLIGWSIDPSTPRNISALIADSFKKFWRIWPDHLVFSLELAHHLLSDIQGILDGQSGVLQKEGDGGMKTNDRSQRRPLSIVLLIKCFHSVIYVITFSTFPTINAECRKPLLQPSDSLYTEYASVIKMGLEIFGTVATKFNDRGWLAQGAGLVKFLSRALQDEFLPFQEASVRYLEAECENILSECDVLGSTDSIRKDIEDWVDRFSEILDVWNPKFSSTLVISLCSLSKSCTLSRLRRVCVAYDDILVRIHKWISMLVTGLSSSSYLLPEPSALLRSFIGEILLETYFIAFSKQGLLDPIGCLTYDTRISHAILDAYNENAELHPYFDAIKDEEATTQTSLLRWNLELLGALIPLPACSDMGCSLLKFFHICIVGFDYNGGGKRDSHIEDVLDYLLLAAYEVCARNDFFVTIASFDDESALDSIFVQLAVIEYAMNTTPMSYDCKLIAATWFTSFTSRLDDVTSSTKFTPDMVSSVLPSVGRALVVLVTNLEFDVDPKIRNMIAEMVKNFTRWFSSVRIHVSAEQYKALRDLLFEVIIPRLSDLDPSVCKSYLGTIRSFCPLDSIILSGRLVGIGDALPKLHSVALSPAFRQKQFQVVMSIIGLDCTDEPRIIRDSVSNAAITNVLERLYHFCFVQNYSVVGHMGLDRNTLTRWALDQAARFCVMFKLRTTLGTAPQTLTLLEKRLKSLLEAVVYKDLDETDVWDRLRQLRLLLTFLDLLEQRIHDALDDISQHSKNVTAFFHDNKRTCYEYFRRMRKALVTGSRVAGMPSQLLKSGLQYISELLPLLSQKDKREQYASNLDDLEGAIFQLCDALVLRGEGDTITGLVAALEQCLFADPDYSQKTDSGISLLKKTAVTSSTSKKVLIDFLKGIRQLAVGQFEAAGLALRKLAKDSFSKKSPFMSNRCLDNILGYVVDCYQKSRDWEGLEEWMAFLHSNVSEPSAEQSIEDIKILVCYRQSNSANGAQEESQQLPVFIGQLGKFGYVRAACRQAEIHYIESTLDSRTGSREDFFHHLYKDWIEVFAGDSPDLLLLPLVYSQLSSWIDSLRSGVGTTETMQIDLDALPSGVGILLSLVALTLECLRGVKGMSNCLSLQLLGAKMSRKCENRHLCEMIISKDPPAVCFEYTHELIKQKIAFQDYATAVDILTTCCLELINRAAGLDCAEPFLAKSLVLLATCIANSAILPFLDNSPSYASCVSLLKDRFPAEHIKLSTLDSANDRMYALSLSIATYFNKSCHKAWLLYGNFWHVKGELIVKALTGRAKDDYWLDVPELVDVQNTLISHFASDGVTGKAHEKLTSLLGHLLPRIECLFDADDLAEKLADFYTSLSTEECESIAAKLIKIRSRVVLYLEESTRAYFECISLVAGNNEIGKLDSLTAALRIFDAFTKFGMQFSADTIAKFKSTTLTPWENLIPQLFARIDHPEPTIRAGISTLLSSIARQSPHLIIYHAVSESEDDSAVLPDHTLRSIMRTAGQQSVIDEVDVFVKELQRVTVLWEEMWLHRLGHVHANVQKRFQKIGDDLAALPAATQNDKSGARQSALNDIYHKLLDPICQNLEELSRITTATPDSTPHELWFTNTYGDRIEEAQKDLCNPPDMENFASSWDKYRKIFEGLGRDLQRNRQLTIAEVSPALALLRRSGVPMPGMPKEAGGRLITIARIERDVQILPTKTKPKKIRFTGSDGKIYAYLLKGLEDLHLDERIQQLLSMVNGLLTKDKRASRRALCARSYPVIPFGQRFGMIKWVEDVVPLFSVYKRWQFHDHAVKLLRSKDKSTRNALSQMPKPHEQYYRKLSAALQRHGLSRKTPRREWPVAVLVDVFHSLKGETPSDLLRKEFLCRSSDSRDWWERTKAFARSSAVMSVVGYVIGLGDRHLDNILIDSKTGEVVHIDYNVCFENGRKLRIPETVPFRLTGIIRDAFGPYGTAGEFRTACEIVLKAMRTKSAEFLILLEAFVYDPLVDWVKKPLIDSEAQLPMITVSNLSHENERTAAPVAVKMEGSPPDGQITTGPVVANGLIEQMDVLKISASNTIGSHEEDSNGSENASSQGSDNRNNFVDTDQGIYHASQPLHQDGGLLHELALLEDLSQPNPEPIIPQERNVFAENILSRVQIKLSGRDTPSRKQISVAEQTTMILKEATNPENLAVMYEGWMPWI